MDICFFCRRNIELQRIFYLMDDKSKLFLGFLKFDVLMWIPVFFNVTSRKFKEL